MEDSLRRIMLHPSRAAMLITFALGLLWLILFAWNVQRGRELAAQAAFYEQAPRCDQDQQTGCRVSAPVRVTHVEEWWAGRAIRHSFTVRRADGRTEVVREAAGNLYPHVREETVLEAEYWQDVIVRLRDSQGHETVSWDDPGWILSNNTTGIYVTSMSRRDWRPCPSR
jgi:hypothetical protein